MTEENTPTLITERLILRRFTDHDAEALFRILSDREVNTFLPMFPLETLEEADTYLVNNYLNKYKMPHAYHYAVCLKTDSIPIGYVNISDDDSHDLGYGLLREFWHQGLITEAGKAVIERLKSSELPYITATHDIQNPRSGAVMKKLGMTYQYTYEEQWQPKNIPVRFRMYQLNLKGQGVSVYKKYWNKYAVHYVEEV